MTAQTTTATITNTINSFISVDIVESLAAEFLTDNYTYCELTEQWHDNNECSHVDYIDSNGRLTEITASDDALNELDQCSDCNAYMHSDAPYSLIGYNHTVCEHCYEENYFYCDSCHESHHNDNYGGDGECESCHRDNEAKQFEHISTSQHDTFTDFKILPNGRPDTATPSNYGYAIGLEIEAYGDYDDEDSFQDDEKHFADTLTEAVHEVWTEQQIPHATRFYSVCSFGNDSSLMSDSDPEKRSGFECEVIPLRVETCERVWSNADVLVAYSRLVKKTNNRCGLHISIGACHHLPAMVYVRINMLMRALELSEDKAKQILGRKPSDYHNNACPNIRNLKNNYRDGGNKTGPLALREKPRKINDKRYYQETYNQERLQGRFEFRAFRAPMQSDLILRRIEYAVSMVEWSKSNIAGFYAMTYRDMIEHFEQFHQERMETAKTKQN